MSDSDHTKGSKELRRLERDIVREKRRIDRLAALRDAAEKSMEAYTLVSARVQILNQELGRAMARNDESRAMEIMAELSPLVAEMKLCRLREEKLNVRLQKLLEKLRKENESPEAKKQ